MCFEPLGLHASSVLLDLDRKRVAARQRSFDNLLIVALALGAGPIVDGPKRPVVSVLPYPPRDGRPFSPGSVMPQLPRREGQNRRQ